MARRRRYRNSGNVLLVLLLLIIIVVAWFQGRIPGVPRPNIVIPQIRGVSKAVPNIPEIVENVTLSAPITPVSSTAEAADGLGARTKTSNCVVSSSLPDRACTPGAILPGATVAQICTAGYASSVRDVDETEKSQAYSEYGITSHTPDQYEVDHLISLELGGSNDIANLWPESASPTPGFHEKDKVENYLHDQVCNGTLSLKEAQAEIVNNWLDVYARMPK